MLPPRPPDRANPPNMVPAHRPPTICCLTTIADPRLLSNPLSCRIYPVGNRSNPYDPAQRFVGGGLLGATSGAAIGAAAAGGPGAAMGAAIGAAAGAFGGAATTPPPYGFYYGYPSYFGYPPYYAYYVYPGYYSYYR